MSVDLMPFRRWLYSDECLDSVVIERSGFAYFTDPRATLQEFDIPVTERNQKRIQNMLTYRFKVAPIVIDRVSR